MKTARTEPSAQSPVFAGIDVGAEELVMVLRKGGAAEAATVFRNTAADRRRLIGKLAKIPNVTTCIEATGTYSMELSIGLHDQGLKLMVVNPQASHNFAKVLGKHSKTDQVDASTLAEFAERMPFVPWHRPSNALLALRAYARRLRTLTDERTAAKNQAHATEYNQHAPSAILKDIQQGITQLDKRIATLTQAALTLIKESPELKTPYELLLSVKGIGDTSAIALLGEILLLPDGLRAPQWVKAAGLDPKHFRSGSSVEKKPRISKAGNRHLRAALFMPALTARRHEPHIKAYADHLALHAKTPMQIICAIMRKLLHSIHAMLKNQTSFNGEKFYLIKDNSLTC